MTQSAVVEKKTYDDREINDYEMAKNVTFTDNSERVRPDTRGFQDVSMFTANNNGSSNQQFVRIKQHQGSD